MSKLLENLLPPDTPPVAKWRLVIAGCILALVIQAAAAWGMFSWAGVPGFVLKSSFEEMMLISMEERIYNTKRLWCTASKDDSRGESRRFYAGELNRMHLKYYRFTGIRMDIPTCDEVGL
jgi:hypothetical protein